MNAIPVLAGILFVAPPPGPDASPQAVRVAIAKSLTRIEKGARSYPRHRRCFSCHHQAMAVLSLTAAQERGFAVDQTLLREQVEFSLRTFRNTALISRGRGVGGDSTGVVYALHTFAASEHPHDDTISALIEYLLVKQRRDGTWPIAAFGDRPPTMGSLFTNVGLAVPMLKKYRPAGNASEARKLQERIDKALSRARDWLQNTTPHGTEDRVFHLRGLVDSGAEKKSIEKARTRLLAEQRPDGSWAQLSRLSGDAYATATVLVALRKAGLPSAHAAYQNGVRYLLRTQNDDGAWIVQTRSKPLQIFFDNGDPGGKSQFISFAATGWAVLALLETLPPSAGK